MQPQTDQDYKQLLTEVIKKQIVILGPDITLSKARNVKGLTVTNDGTVTAVEGHPQEVTQALIDQFVQLSGLIVKKTMEPLLSLSQPITAETIPGTTPNASTLPSIQPLPIQTNTQNSPTTQQTMPITTPSQTQVASNNPTPANNPLAA